MLQRMVVTAILAAACGAAEAGPSLIDTPENPSSGGTAAAITGTVTDAQLRPVGGGTVEVLAGTTVVQTATVSAGGSYSVPTLAAGTYAVRLQPPLNFSIGPSESSQRSVTLAANPTTAATVSFTVQPALAYDDFQAYSSTQQILAFCSTSNLPAGNFWAGAGRDGNCNIQAPSTGNQIVFDPAGGPNGSKSIRYDWAARPTCPNGPTACSITVGLYPRLKQLTGIGNELWIRFTDKLSPGFKAGGGGAVSSQIEYKYLFLDVMIPGAPGSGVGQFQVELENAAGGPAVANYLLRTKIVDYVNRPITSDRNANPPGPGDYRLGVGFDGKWHTWVFGITDIGSPAVTFTAYLDGVEVLRLTGAWFPGKLLSTPGAVLGIQMGANINNGPDQPQSRWWRELGVYRTRPSLKPLVVQ